MTPSSSAADLPIVAVVGQGFVSGSKRWRAPWRVMPSWVPTRFECKQLAVGCYMWSDAADTFTAFALDVLTVTEGRVGSVTAFLDAELFLLFGLEKRM